MKFKEKIDSYTYSLTLFFMENDHAFSKRKTGQIDSLRKIIILKIQYDMYHAIVVFDV